jgi:hypothetical protein
MIPFYDYPVLFWLWPGLETGLGLSWVLGKAELLVLVGELELRLAELFPGVAESAVLGREGGRGCMGKGAEGYPPVDALDRLEWGPL